MFQNIMTTKIIKGKILEYDMRAAGPSVFAEKGLISEELFLDLLEDDKLHRNIMIGSLKDEELEKLKNDGIKEYVDKFIKVNDIQPHEILEIAKDAIFLQRQEVKHTILGDYVRFVLKGTYYFMFEFPINDNPGTKQTIKLYKTDEGLLKCRGGKIAVNEMAYERLIDVINSKINNTKFYPKYVSFVKDLDGMTKEGYELISGVSNEHLQKCIADMELK